ncbi:hypothetical protein Taro_007103, partial [Colocasia esculenta]|nr:hypothetical protein [Colocasia esculenta]
ENDLGTTSLAILYLSFTLFSLVPSSMVKVLGLKNALVLGTTGYWLFIVANLKSSWFVLHACISKVVGNLVSLALLRGGKAYVWSGFTKHIVRPALRESGLVEQWQCMGLLVQCEALYKVVSKQNVYRVLADFWVVYIWPILNHSVCFWWSSSSDSCSFMASAKIQLTSSALGSVYLLIMAAIWATGNGVFSTQLNALLGMLFRHNMDVAFAQLRIWQNASTALVFFLSPHITFQAMPLVMIITLLFLVLAFMFLTLYIEKAFALEP